LTNAETVAINVLGYSPLNSQSNNNLIQYYLWQPSRRRRWPSADGDWR
jgi:hypothetical protein